MADKRWKRYEREVGELLGGTRIPINGRTGVDVDHPTLGIECKTRQELPQWLLKAFSQASSSEGKIPIVVLHLVGARKTGDIVLIRLSDFAKLLTDLRGGDTIPSASFPKTPNAKQKKGGTM